MYELYPYFTNDGTVGLFSKSDNDIYHSTYGALSESWQKFVLPSNLEHYIETHADIKILDICYGIGYNSKTALQTFINIIKKNNNLRKNSINNYSTTHPEIAAIGSDNILPSVDKKKFDKNSKIQKENANFNINNCSMVGAIYADNISCEQNNKSTEIYNKNFDSAQNTISTFNQDVDTSTILHGTVCNDNKSTNSAIHKSITIDAIDTDKTLIGISPFIVSEQSTYCKLLERLNLVRNPIEKILKSENKFKQINDIKNSKTKLLNNYKISEECQLIILQKIIESDLNIFDDDNIKQILNEKKYLRYFDRFRLNYAKFYSNWTYKQKDNVNKSTFLHNIYYRYISNSYKFTQNLLKNNKIDIKFHNQDAREFIATNSTLYNFIFLDAFTPAKCPTLWSVHFFKELYKSLDNDGMILTYSNSAAVRNALLTNNFFVGKIYDSALNKFVGTVAVKNKKLIEHELDEKDLALINSKAGITYEDCDLSLTNEEIIRNRNSVVETSNLVSSTKAIKGLKNG